ncbi:MAG: hypothetical protein C5B44_05260 [Acidobacteria bacterium]|nr:MAG: hypothetical protein C5B44_05260 [Acidobacteriota bacterium]
MFCFRVISWIAWRDPKNRSTAPHEATRITTIGLKTPDSRLQTLIWAQRKNVGGVTTQDKRNSISGTNLRLSPGPTIDPTTVDQLGNGETHAVSPQARSVSIENTGFR